MTHFTYYSSQLGDRGTEGLGGGMAAAFWLEAGVANDVGQGASSNTNNQIAARPPPVAWHSTSVLRPACPAVGAKSTLDVTSLHKSGTFGAFDPFYLNGVGASVLNPRNLTGVTAIVASNTVGYLLPGGLGGFYGQAQRYLGENPSVPAAAKHDGNGWGVRFGYAEGRLNVHVFRIV